MACRQAVRQQAKWRVWKRISSHPPMLIVGKFTLVFRLGHRRLPGRVRKLAEREPHHSDFLLLGDDDLLRKTLEPLVMAIAQFRKSHLDRAFMMRDHDAREIRIDVSRGPDTMLIII